MTLQIRINELIAEKSISKAALAREVDCSRATVTDWANGNTKDITGVYLLRVAKFFGVNELWLSSGNGPKYRKDIPPSSVTSNSNTVNETSGMVYISTENGGRRMEFTHVQSYELWSGESEKEVRGMTVPTKWIEEDGADPASLVSIELPDDAQGPRRVKGDVVVVKTEYGDTLKNDKLYAIRIGATYTLRLVAILGSGDIRMCCANPDYKHAEEQIKKDDVGNLDILGEYFSAAIR